MLSEVPPFEPGVGQNIASCASLRPDLWWHWFEAWPPWWCWFEAWPQWWPWFEAWPQWRPWFVAWPQWLLWLQAIFLTTLFYLLAFSGSQYKPVEFFTGMSPSLGSGGTASSTTSSAPTSGDRFGQAVEQAIRWVEVAEQFSPFSVIPSFLKLFSDPFLSENPLWPPFYETLWPHFFLKSFSGPLSFFWNPFFDHLCCETFLWPFFFFFLSKDHPLFWDHICWLLIFFFTVVL